MTSVGGVRGVFRLCSNLKWTSNGTHFGRVSSFTRRSSSHNQNSKRCCSYSWSHKQKSSQNKINEYGYISVGVLGISAILFYRLKKFQCQAEEKATEHGTDLVPGEFIKGLPEYKSDEVAQHKSKETGIWVIYKYGVYDVTEFVEQHPGGTKILLAAGSSIEPFWRLYAVHHTSEVYEILEEHRIGNLNATDAEKKIDVTDPYSTDPERHPALIPASLKPFNAEPPSSLLVDSFYTPNDIFYVRNHLPVPNVDPKDYRLEVKGLGLKDRTFTLADIKQFPKHTITATVQCAGNRRSEMSQIKTVKGLTWNQAAIGNATWSGAKLSDVLKSCGFNGHPDIEHVQFEGLDKGPDNLPYGASVPAYKILHPQSDVILAYEMNGVELSRDHGYPLRVIVPGIVGARNVKWVTKIVLSEKESDSFWQQSDYKGFSPSTDWDTVDFTKAPAVQELPVNSVICVPQNGDAVDLYDGNILVKGYAWAGGGNPIIRVDLTADGGKTWHVADLEQVQDKTSRRWAWTLWSALIPIDESQSSAEIWVKAVDSSYNTQPESFQNIWNLRGLLSNAYHKVRVQLKREEAEQVAGKGRQ